MQKKPHITHVSKLIVGALLVGALGVAQAGPVGVGAVGGAGARVGVSGLGVGAAGGFGGNGAAGLHGGAAGVGSHVDASAGAAIAPGTPDLRVDQSGFESLGMHQARLSAQAESAGGKALQAPGMTVANEHAIDAVANAGPAEAKVREASIESRDEIATDIEGQVTATSKAMTKLDAEAKSLNADQRGEFRTAVKDAHAAEKAVKKSLKAVRKATPETWATARADLATHYAAYVNAAQRAQGAVTAAHVAPTAAANAAAQASGEAK